MSRQAQENKGFQKACKDFLAMQPKIQKIKEKLNNLSAKNKENIEIIKSHMVEHELEEINVGAFTFANREVERCRWNEKNLKKIIEDADVFDRYRQEFTETKKSFSMSRPKKRPRSDD